jgi:hypothetical protein
MVNQISGWDVETLQQVIDHCDTRHSGMHKCPGLIGGVNGAGQGAEICNIDNKVRENVLGVMEKLPGINPVRQWGVHTRLTDATSTVTRKATTFKATFNTAGGSPPSFVPAIKAARPAP